MRKFICLVTAATVLAVPAVASAKTIRQAGQIVGDKEATITMQVKTSGKDPLSVANFKAKNVFTRCEGEPSRIDFTVLDAVPVSKDNRFKSRLVDGEGGVLRINGKVKDNGKATVGSMKTNNFTSADGVTCKTPKQRFKTQA